MSDYELEEIKGRGYYISIFPKVHTDFSPVKDKAVWDCSGSTLTTDWLGEIKIRYQNVDSFSTSFLEVKKYQALKELADKLDLTMCYINVYADATVTYNLSNLPIDSYEVTLEYCPVATSEDARGYTFKDMINLPKEAVSRKINIGYRRLEGWQK
ncbi:hypothetical protein [Mucilaginibacter ginsenosidivorax]|uniref:Uncharacterized protein n=1 Tax=Mucilaginibacter ginsenosidivorax TaxID=862126 RepID=A0A5B8W924_9SPHI|nr:hypothetical protein [Mucilaginibacter ginsenosidivorax]QEC78748.1 hypothetical protein FSB76_23390 [Mucilaginibacter ginsenosidivorax]